METQLIYAETIGPFRVLLSGRPVQLQRAKDRALFAFLALNKGRAFTRTFLANLLWEPESETKARHSLNQSIYTLRRALPSAITAMRETVVCDSAAVRTDVDAFREHIRSGNTLMAADVVRGDFLEDIQLQNAAGFEEWKEHYRRNLFFHFKTATQNIPEAAQAAGLLPEIQALPELTDLLRSIVTRTHTNLTTGPVPRVQTDGARSLQAYGCFSGRVEQLATLHNAWKSSNAGPANYVLIRGFAGHGKTRLAEQFIQQLVQQGPRILKVNCYEAERAVAFGPIADLLKTSFSPSDVEKLDDIWSAAIHQIAPHLVQHPTALPLLSSAGAESRLFEAFLTLLAHIAKRQPTLIFIDDVQWCDAATRALLSYISRQRIDAPFLIVAALRIQSRASDVIAPWNAWRQVEVSEFNENELEQLSRDMERSNGLSVPARQVARLTAGHPFLVGELIRILQTDRNTDPGRLLKSVPSTVEEFLANALASMPIICREAAAALAILKRPAKSSVVAEIARADAFWEVGSALVDSGIIDLNGERLRFRHELLREATLRRTPALVRAELHRRAASTFARMPGRTGEAAEHFFHAGMRHRAFAYAIKAADLAEERQRPTQATYYLKLALRARHRSGERLRGRLAQLLYKAGKFRQARRQLRYVLSHPARFSQREVVANKLLDLEIAYSLAAISGPTLLNELDRIITEDQTDPDLVSRAMRLQLRSAMLEGATPVIGKRTAQLHAFGVSHLDSSEGVLALATAVQAMSVAQSTQAAEQAAVPLYDLLDTIDDHELRIQVLILLGTAAYHSGRLQYAESLNRRALEEIKQVGAMTLWSRAVTHLYGISIEQGKYNIADELGESFVNRTGKDEVQNRSTFHGNRATMMFELGRYDDAYEEAVQGLASSDNFYVVWHVILLRGLVGLVELERGNLQEAIRAAEFGIQEFGRLGIRLMDVSAMDILIARVKGIRGDRGSAVAWLEDALTSYGDRELICRLQLRLELARQLKAIDRHAAREHAKAVFETARTIGARPIADRADSLLYRL